MLCGADFELVLKHNAVSERCLQKWIKAYNERGIDGVTYRPKSGRPRHVEPSVVAREIIPLVEAPEQAGHRHWTAVKLCGWLNENKKLNLSYPTLVRYLHEHGVVRKIPRPMPEPRDPDLWEDQREAFVDKLLDMLEAPKTDVFFGDEAGFEGDPRPRHKWVKRGSRPTQGYYGGHLRRNVIGAVNPADGQLVSLIVPHTDTLVFQAFLDTMAIEVPPRDGRKLCLVLDNASWHKAKALNWHHIHAVFLPPYSPDFNPIERLWQYLKSQYMAGFVTNDGDELSDMIFDSIRDLLGQPKIIKSICNTHHD